jgi:hypothetical protein
MNYRGLKAAKAFAFGVVLSGLVVGCENGLVKDKAVAPEQNATAQQTSPKVERIAQHDERGAYYISPLNGSKVYVSELQEMTKDLSTLAKATAIALDEKNVREWFYQRCAERFDGESNVLWLNLDVDKAAPATLRSSSSSSGKVWTDNLAHTLASNEQIRHNNSFAGGKSVNDVRVRLEEIFNAPLHFFWMKPELWDKKTAPIVAFVRVDIDPKEQKALTAFDAKGNVLTIDKEIAKTRPVVLISFNERSDVSGQLKSNLANTAQTKGSISSPSKRTASTTAWEDIPAILTLDNVYFNSWANYDELDGSTPEFWVEVLRTNDWYKLREHYIGERPTATWITMNFTLTNGVPRLYDVVVKYWEEDFWFFDDYVGEHRFRCSPATGTFTASGGNPAANYSWVPEY